MGTTRNAAIMYGQLDARTGATIQVSSIANAQEEFKALLHLCELRGIKGRHLSEKLEHIQNVLSAR